MRRVKPTRSSEAASRRRLNRGGSAAVEVAIVLPLLATVVFGAMELSNAMFLKQSLNIAAYESAKVVTRPGDNVTLARTRCAEILASRGVTQFNLTFSPTVTPTTARGTAIQVNLTATSTNLSYGPLQFMLGKTVTSSVVMVRL